jgi:SAM-dependent methyltransferase
MLRDAGLDAYGADVFFEGADWDDPQVRELIDAGHVKEIAADGLIPYDDASFDLVISNQVLEHIEDPRPVLAELGRVLKPGGSMYHHFPSREVLREGHIGIALAHRLRPGRVRTLYTLTLRRLGFGSFKDEYPTAREWTDAKLAWIDTYCFYRPYADLRAVLSDGYALHHHEIDYCRFRAAGRPALERLMSVRALRVPIEHTFRRLAFMAIEQRRV